MQKINNSDVASIREVYAIAQRLEEKINKIDERVANMEGKASIVAIIWSSIISIAGISAGYFLKK